MRVALAILFVILLGESVACQGLPDGVSVDGKGVYIIQRKALRQLTRTERAAFKKLADDNGIKYKLEGKK